MHSQESLLLAIAGSAILTIGVLALWAHFTSALSHERILLWFGLFASPYGTSLLCRSASSIAWDVDAQPMTLVVARLMGLLSIIPAIMLFEEFYGVGWRRASKWLTGLYVLSMIGVFVLMAFHNVHQTVPSPGIALVALIPVEIILGWATGYKPPLVKHRVVVFLGLFVFFLTFAYDHLGHLSSHHLNAPTEPFGFLGLTLCLGIVVSRRVASNEAEWRTYAGEMDAARRIQAAILPDAMPRVSGFSVAARYSPMTAVAGDYYSFPSVGPNSFGVVVADVMGHGVPAALVASMIKVAVLASAEKCERPFEVIAELNKTMCKEAPGQLMTAVYVSMDKSRRLGVYSAAGHPPPVLWRHAMQKLETLDAPGLLLGVRSEEPFSEREFDFAVGDRLLLYSDGLTEAENSLGTSFGDGRLPGLIAASQSLDTEAFASRLLDEVLQWSSRGSEQVQADDITFVVIDIR